MTSQINTTNIDITYPIAGQDNDTQGFRDNFRNIKTNLNFAQSEISAIQSILNNISATSTVVLPSVPPTPTAAGTKGQMAYDGNYFYICIATNTWRRVAISTWS